MTTLEIILGGVVALQGFTSIRFELVGRQIKRSLAPPPHDQHDHDRRAKNEDRPQHPL